MSEEWVSLREFSRRRGVRLAAVQKAIASGRVTAIRRGDTGRLKEIEFVQASAQWDANTDPAEAAKNGKFLGAETILGSETIGTPPPPRGELPLGESAPNVAQGSHASLNTGLLAAVGPGAADAGDSPAGAGLAAATGAAPTQDKDPHGYYAARAERERINAAQQQLDYSKALGHLVSVAEVKQLSSRRYRAIRDRILNIPDRVAAVLAAEREPAQVHALLTVELKRVLHELSDDARTEAAGGVAVGVAA